MQKIKVRKEVFDEVKDKLEASKNIFARGDFDEYKISDEELREHEIIKSRIPKYLNKISLGNGKYKYIYFDDKTNKTRELLPRIEYTKAKVLPCNVKNAATVGKQFLKDWNDDWKKNPEKARIWALNNSPVKLLTTGKNKITLFHFDHKGGGKKRNPKDVYERALLLPYTKKMLEGVNLCLVNEVRKHPDHVEYELVGKAQINGVDRLISVIISKMYGDKKVYIDTINKAISENDMAYINDVYFTDPKTLTNQVKLNLGISDSNNRLKESLSNNALQTSGKLQSSAFENYSNRKPKHNLNIPQQPILSSKNVNKSLTYSGHKLQGRTRLYGMDISIENKKGSYRSGTDKDGHKWRCYMNYDYGYIRGTEGVDSDHVDVYIGNDENAKKVYIIHQNDPVTHKYDEDKCMLCFSSAADAKKAYMKQYDRPGFYGSMTTMTIDQFKSFIFSKKGKMIHKSFDIQITDITENNKQQKLEQFEKALNAIADNKPFVIKHIPADNSEHYENLTVRLMDFDRSKIEKAVHKVALSLDADISGASKGESFVYKSQEELVDKYFKEFTNRTRAVYNFVISYFDLPDIRIVSKAGELKYKGKILYNPETGKPIKESEWKRFVEELEKFLNRNYTGMGEKIVLSSESLGIILDRLSKTNSLEAIRKMSVSDLKAKRYNVDWISESVKNMKDTFGDVISRERQARIQIACDSAAQRVTRVKDDMRNNIQQIIIDGIRDKQSKSVVAQNLFDKCASLNRDMQRIADTEVQMASNSAYCKEEVYNSEPGEKVYFKRFEMMDDNTCKECKKLNGVIALWSDVPLPDEHIRDPYAKYAIWEGKNEGVCPISVKHPWCRGTWVRYYPDLD